MLESIVVALITGVCTLAGALLSGKATSDRMQAELAKAQAVTDTKLAELTREVREHNNFARRMPVIEEQIKVINHRIADLEK